MIAQLEDDERAEALEALPDWDFDDARDALTRSFVFADFSEAFAFMARVMASGADIWLLDEPGNGLDKDALTLLDAAMAVHRVNGGIVLAASHQSLGLDGARFVNLGAG